MDAYLICPETRTALWLGKPIRLQDSNGTLKVRYYHRGAFDEPLNHEDTQLNKVLWKFLADHAHKELRVVFSGEFNDDVYERIGSGDVETEEYLRGWPPKPDDPMPPA